MKRIARAALPALLSATVMPCARAAPPGLEATLAHAPVSRAAFCLWSTTSFGLQRIEAAAWVVAREDGEVALQPWPVSGRTHQARFTGAPPRGAVAIVHTHPESDDPRPSMLDRQTAREIGLPISTVSRDGVWTALPEGRVIQRAGRAWYAPYRELRSCDAEPARNRVERPREPITTAFAGAPEDDRGSWRKE